MTGSDALRRRSRPIRIAAAALAAAGLGLSGYLVLRTFALLSGDVAGSIDVCSAVFGVGCDATLAGRSGALFGAPLAGWGLAYFAILACLLGLSHVLGERFDRDGWAAAALLALPGVAVSALLTALIVSGRVPPCPACIAVHAINLALLVVLVRGSGPFPRELADRVAAGLRWAARGEAATSRDATWKAIALASCLLAGVVLYQAVLVGTVARRQAGTLDPQKAYAAYQSEPTRQIAVAADDPRLGAPGAPVQLVVFADFQCPGCRDVAPLLRRIVEQSAGRVSLVFKHAPLSPSCNPDVRHDLHPHACEAAFAAEAARLQGRFFEFHDALFATDAALGERAIDAAARAERLDLVRFAADRASDAVRARVRQDVQAAHDAGVDGTPCVFLDGRRVRDLRPALLELLVLRAIGATPR